MNICFMCDLHLPVFRESLQYDVLEWAINDIKNKKPDCIAYVGDVTCDGNMDTYTFFVDKMQSIGIPFLYVPGNSDLRDENSFEKIKNLSSPCKNLIGDRYIFAVNDCTGEVSDYDLSLINEASETSIVFMHHPIASLNENSRSKMLAWRESHSKTMLFYGHKHRSRSDGCDVSLQAMDPDKSIGENPCITYYNTESSELRKAYYFSAVPCDIYKYFGLSCYKIEENIELAIKHGLKNLELRKSCIHFDEAKLASLIKKWRDAGGENLSIHLPDISYSEGKVLPDAELQKYMRLANKLSADRFTQHVPKITVSEAKNSKNALSDIADALAEAYNTVDHDMIIGIENMHMTAKDTPDENRRFGYIPEECLAFMELVSARCKHKVGINFDIGHARNNAPYSQKYQIGSWMALLGKYVVGYHMHQVNNENGFFENHIAIGDVYGRLISYSSFFRYWSELRINKAPIIFEMRPEGAYETTVETFNKHKNKKIFDLHSHTYYSNCSEDDPHDLIKAAISSGVSLLAITDHRHGIKDRVSQYVNEIRSLAKQYEDRIRILCGIEIATLPYKFDPNVREAVKECDFCLIEHIDEPDSTVGNKLFEFAETLGIRCGIAHTDLFKYCDIFGYDYNEFFKKLADAGIFWEMNVNYDSTHKYREHKYVNDFMNDASKIEIIKKSGVYISIGFDSHIAKDYDGFKLHQMYDFLTNNGIKTADRLF